MCMKMIKIKAMTIQMNIHYKYIFIWTCLHLCRNIYEYELEQITVFHLQYIIIILYIYIEFTLGWDIFNRKKYY